jgi:hypothetical protein
MDQWLNNHTDNDIIHTDSLTKIDSLYSCHGLYGHSIEVAERFRLIFFGDFYGHLTIWRYAERPRFQRIQKLQAFNSSIYQVKFLDQSRRLFVSADHVKIYNIGDDGRLRQLKFIRHSNIALSMILLPKYKCFITSGAIQPLQLWNIKTLVSQGEVDTKGKKGTGYTLLYVDKFSILICGFMNGQIGLYDAKEHFLEISVFKTESSDWNISLGFSEKYNLLLGCVGFRKVKTWKFSSRDKVTPVHEYTIPCDDLYDIKERIIDNRDSLVILGHNSNVLIFDLETGIFDRVKGLYAKYSAMKFMRNGKIWLLAASKQIDIYQYE